MSKKQDTLDTYNKAAAAYAKKFNELDRMADIYEVFKLNKKISPNVLEIGCGNGRDAKIISKYTKDYLGIDYSQEFVKIASSENPKLKFEIFDVEEYIFPKELDIVFAFASLLHVDKESFRIILQKIHNVLNPGGLIKLSLKYSPDYKTVEKTDEYGTRTFYFYCDQDIQDISLGYKILKMIKVDLRGQTWLEVILQKE